MKSVTLLKTTLAASIALASLMAMTGCTWDHDDHHDDWDHANDPHANDQNNDQDNHQDNHQDDHHQDDPANH